MSKIISNKMKLTPDLSKFLFLTTWDEFTYIPPNTSKIFYATIVGGIPPYTYKWEREINGQMTSVGSSLSPILILDNVSKSDEGKISVTCSCLGYDSIKMVSQIVIGVKKENSIIQSSSKVSVLENNDNNRLRWAKELPLPSIITIPYNILFRITVAILGGIPPFKYRWRYENEFWLEKPLPNNNTPYLSIESFNPLNLGKYWVEVEDSGGMFP